MQKGGDVITIAVASRLMKYIKNYGCDIQDI